MLFPNQFVNTRLLVDTIKDAVIVPTSAVLNGSMGQFVYVVKPDNTVTVRPVKIGPVDGERTSIESGLQVGRARGDRRLGPPEGRREDHDSGRQVRAAHRARMARPARAGIGRIGRVAARMDIIANTRRKPRNKGD